MATHKISYGVVLAGALERMCTGCTVRASKQTATDSSTSSSHMIKLVLICSGSHFPRAIILADYRFRWYGFCLLVPLASIPLPLGYLALFSFD